MKNLTKTAGFTLIELMITVAIVAILATVAVTSYRGAILRSNRTDAKAVLLNIQVAQEKAFLQYNRYAQNATEMAANPGANTPGLSIPTTTTGGRYNVDLNPTAGGGYTATATATGSQLDDTTCNVFSINNKGLKSATNSSSADSPTCWSK